MAAKRIQSWRKYPDDRLATGSEQKAAQRTIAVGRIFESVKLVAGSRIPTTTKKRRAVSRRATAMASHENLLEGSKSNPANWS